MTGGPLNLSLLSRGVGEVHKNGHEKVDVYLEPEDYYNFSTSTDRFYLPPIHTSYPSFIVSPSTRSSREACEFRVPKTFTTRKGALLLFSEDMAQRNMERAAKRRAAASMGHSHGASMTPSTSLDSQVALKTVEDLANSILKYGSYDRPDDKVYLKFVHARRDNYERQIRPGFSAKRYLSTWTRTWDDTVFDNIIKQGYITERSLYHYNLVVPNLRRRLFYEDLSHMPQPYRLMRNMLMTPGSLSGYTFYRAPTQVFDEEEQHDDDTLILKKRREKLRNIRVIKTKGGIQEEVAYSDLDRQSQKEVITDLLVKSAVHYALRKQEEIYEENLIRAVHTEQTGGVLVGADGEMRDRVAHEFDMKEAVESLLDSQHGRFAIGADLPEIDDRSHSSDVGGSFKGGTLPSRLAKQHQPSHRPSGTTDTFSEADKEYMGGLPIVAVRDGSETASQHSTVPVLPPIRQTLSPIKDVSRETTQHITLPPLGREYSMSEYTHSTSYPEDGVSTDPPTVNIQPATPQHSILTAGSQSGQATSDANATRGLISRDAHELPELEEEREGDSGTGTDLSKKKGEISEASGHSSEKDKGKAASSDAGAVDSAIHAGPTSTIGTGTTGTNKTRPNWKTQGLRKGPTTELHQKGIMFKPPEHSKPITGLAGLQGHTPLSYSTLSHHDADPNHLHSAPHSSCPSSVASWHLETEGRSLKPKPRVKKAGSQAESVKGSVIMAPDGEIISLGGSMARGGGVAYDVGNINDVMGSHRAEGAGTDESGASDDEPDEWKIAKKHSLQRSESIKKPHKREIDYTSGDIDATMSIHSWSYAAREHDHEAMAAASVRSLPGLQLDGGTRDSTSEDHEQQLTPQSSDGEHWARITERPEEEEIANIDSREVTQEEIHIPKVPSPTPVTEVDVAEEAAENEKEEVEEADEQKSHTTRSIALQTDSEGSLKGSHKDGKNGILRVSKTPRRSECDADDEADDEEEEEDSGWPMEGRDTQLDVVKEESREVSSRRHSNMSKQEQSRPESTLKPESQAKSAGAESPTKASATKTPASKTPGSKSPGTKSPTKSVAPSRTSDRKSAQNGEGAAPTSAGERGAKLSASTAEKQASDGRKSTATSKAKSRTVSVDKSPQPSSKGGRDTVESKSPIKGDKTPSKKGEQSGRSSMKSKRADSQAKSRTTTRLSGAKLKAPPADGEEEAGEEAVDNPWDDEDGVDDIEDYAGQDLEDKEGIDDADDYRMPSTPSEDNAKVSGEETHQKNGFDLSVQGEQLLTPPRTPSPGKKRHSMTDRESGSQKSDVTEKDIMDTLTDHAQRIADSVLSHPAAGLDLESDVQQAAQLWTETHPPRPLSRAHSVREFRADAIAEIMRNRRASSAAPSMAEYKALIKKSLAAAAARAAGLDPDSISDDAEISPELLDALASHKLTPDQLEIVSDSDGKTRIQSRVDLNELMGGVQDGHLYIAPGKKGEAEGMGKRQISIPADKVSVMDDVEFDRISYQGTDVMSEKGKSKSKAGSKAGSIAGGTMADLSEMEGMMAAIEGKVEDGPGEEDDFLKAVQHAAGQPQAKTPSEPKQPTSGRTTPSAVSASKEGAAHATPPTLPPDQGPTEKKAEDARSVKSSKTGVSQKSEASKDSKKKGKKSPEEKEEPFVVGKPDQKGELEKLYGPVDLPPPKQEEKEKKLLTPEQKAPTPEEKAPVPQEQEEKKEAKPGSAEKKISPPGAPKVTPAGKAPEPEPASTTDAAPAAAAGGEDGVIDHVSELAKLYGGKLPAPVPPQKQGSPKGKPKEKKPKKEPLPPKKEEKKKKGKKGKKKKKEEEPAPAPEPEPVEEPPAPEPVKEETPRKPTPVSSEPKPSSPEFKTDESDVEFNFVREQSSPELDPIPQTKLYIPSPPLDEEEKSDENLDEEEEDTNLKSISNREARAAKRAAAAAKRREEVERRRKEKEEQAKREKEEVERQIALQREMEEERRRREEERRIRKLQQKEAEERERAESEEAERRQRMEADREKRAKEEYQRKLEEMKRKQHEDEMRKHELMLQRQREEEERRAAEELMLSQMAEQERLEYEKKKKEEEEARKRKELEEKLRRAEEAKKAMEEAQRLAEEMARKQAELEARLKFNRALQEEASGLSHAHEINRAFVFSYFELLQWLGLDIPEFELAKLADY